MSKPPPDGIHLSNETAWGEGGAVRSLRVMLTVTLLALVLGLEAMVLLGPAAFGLSGPGRRQGGVVAPTLLRLLSVNTPRPAPEPPLPAPAASPPPTAASPAPAASPAAPPATKPAPQPAAAPAGKPPAVRKHTIEAGETLWELSRHYGVALDALISANRGVDPGDLQIGQVLTIPSGSTAGPATREPEAASLAHAFIWPALAPISSLYGPRWGGFHTGLDLAVAAGTEVHAAREGKVELADWLGGYGLTVILDHPDGTKSLYAHNSKLLVSAGDTVRQGQVLALSGNTGHSTGPHLHFELIVGNRPRDPLQYLPDVGLAVQENR